MSPFWTTDEAAVYLRLSGASSIRSLVGRGELTPVGRRGRRGPYLFRQEELDRWVVSCLGSASCHTDSCQSTAPVVGQDPEGGCGEKATLSGADPATGRKVQGAGDSARRAYRQVARGNQDPGARREEGGGAGGAGEAQDRVARGTTTPNPSAKDYRERLRRAVARGQGKEDSARSGRALHPEPEPVHPALSG
ncbi:MAG: hypothetical protein UT86_C0001G0230 [Candidatus Magasanikbacteria bacterium GW2011_GWC2_40_17]|uniref:Helix-turn-helix domain-containing protein n=1 Tax=Candidatus Magasanikbacteria bacterium GW2011_GWA2_42_32 TaxID=1619039 RepID=A0A0G1A9A1_9BACT|nr:MAG: hypothetical protein UT86_C0001G0230 [Candidatus Magasanikbacteria bacterium GW2011_GWC2_40_17]KKS57590.1 MAG: hypothetical protein UV20_C0001G0230 [Candidatus Magasanikbacteria bacterium GW2011_GWA2_42_32]